ncbi:MAG: hypothetical protein ACO3JL_18185, partial [Myxococcota bacterium]
DKCDADLARAEAFVSRTSLRETPQRLLLHATMLRRTGHTDAARGKLARVFDFNPGHQEAHRLRILWAQEDGDDSWDAYVAEAERWGVRVDH